MLVLSRKKNESIMIGDDIRVEIAEIRGDKVRLAFQAPKDVIIHRREVYDAIKKQKQVPLKSGVPSEKWEPKEGEEYCELTLQDDFPTGSIVKWGYDTESFWYRTEEDLPKGSRLAFPVACAGPGHCSIIHDERLTEPE